MSAYTKKGQKSPSHAHRSVVEVQTASKGTGSQNDGFVSRNAVPFSKKNVSQLTPTMRNFTLEGKVAVVTG